jgi:hypothetical protein
LCPCRRLKDVQIGANSVWQRREATISVFKHAMQVDIHSQIESDAVAFTVASATEQETAE